MNDVTQTRVQLGGGIGAGKSAVAGALEARGVPVIHADGIGHLVLEPEGEAFAPVSAWWPEVVVDGVIDRSRLAEIVFADPQALRDLEAMTHPAIRSRIEAQLLEHGDAAVVVVEVPLLTNFLGDGWLQVVVDAPDATRRARLRERGMAKADIEARMAAQPNGDEWRAAADFVLDNSRSLADLEVEIDRLLAWLAERPTTGSA